MYTQRRGTTSVEMPFQSTSFNTNRHISIRIRFDTSAKKNGRLRTRINVITYKTRVSMKNL